MNEIWAKTVCILKSFLSPTAKIPPENSGNVLPNVFSYFLAVILVITELFCFAVNCFFSKAIYLFSVKFCYDEQRGSLLHWFVVLPLNSAHTCIFFHFLEGSGILLGYYFSLVFTMLISYALHLAYGKMFV